MGAKQKEVVVSTGVRPFWQTIIAASLYTVTLGFLLMFLYVLYKDHFEGNKINSAVGFFKLAIYTFIGALNFSVVKTIYINLDKEKLKTEYSVGMINIRYYSKIPTLEYVSAFLNPGTLVYEVNLWYKGNKHFNVSAYDEFQPAFDFGVLFSDKLNIDLLDATEKGNFKWIDKIKIDTSK